MCWLLAGDVSTYSGSNNIHVDGVGSQVLFGAINGVTLDSNGVMFVTDNNHAIHKVQTNGE